MVYTRPMTVLFALSGLWLYSAAANRAHAAPPPNAKQMLAIGPTQRFVETDSLSPDRAAACKVEVLRKGRTTGWVLKDATGRVYRKFMDTNRDRVVDTWCYFRDGVEVYRDLDANFNGRADQFRWLNQGGTRWGYDKGEDGAIDGYYILSPEEATRETFRALATNDFARLAPVLAGPGDVSALGKVVSAKRLKQLSSQARRQFSRLNPKLGHWTAESRWVRFAAEIPRLIPGAAADGSQDLFLYPTALAVIQTGEQVDLLQFSNLVCIGRACKILEIPTLVPEEGGELVASNQASRSSGSASAQAFSSVPSNSKEQELFERLGSLDAKAAAAGNPTALLQYQMERADILEALAKASRTQEQRREWQQQMVDTLISALQVKHSPSAAQRLDKLLETERKRNGNSPLAAYIAFRQLSVDYSQKIQSPDSDFAAVQKEWLGNLKKFVADFPDAEDTPEGLAQLALGLEFTGDDAQARKYYGQLVSKFTDSPAAKRAAGAVRRLDLVGKSMQLAGRDLRNRTMNIQKLKGRVILVSYWASWCEPCKAELNELKSIYQKYHQKGFEIIGVSVDTKKQAVVDFVRSTGLQWPVLFEPGGLDSPLASQYGITSLPSHFLVDRTGKVVSRTIHVTQLETELKKLLR